MATESAVAKDPQEGANRACPSFLRRPNARRRSQAGVIFVVSAALPEASKWPVSEAHVRGGALGYPFALSYELISDDIMLTWSNNRRHSGIPLKLIHRRRDWRLSTRID